MFAFSPPGKGRGRRPNDASPTEVCLIVCLHVCLQLDVCLGHLDSGYYKHDMSLKKLSGVKFWTYAVLNGVSLKSICFPILDELC